LRFGISAVLIYFAFRKVNIIKILAELKQVPVWFVVANVFYYFLITILGSYRWSLLVLKRPSFKQVLDFTKASYSGLFYALFFPTGVAGDLLKWIPLQKKYPELSKTKLLSSSLLDRVIGFTAFILVAFVSAIIGKILNYNFPGYLLWIFGLFFVAVVGFYVLVFNIDIENIFKKIPLINRINDIVDLLKAENKNRLLKCLMVAFVSEFAWITPIWFTSLVFSAGFPLLSVYIFMPIIALILVLPISIAGFGARENLYLIFFSQLGIVDDKILLVSAFVGILGVFNALLGGIWLLF
jgi:hypothetical protein